MLLVIKMVGRFRHKTNISPPTHPHTHTHTHTHSHIHPPPPTYTQTHRHRHTHTHTHTHTHPYPPSHTHIHTPTHTHTHTTRIGFNNKQETKELTKKNKIERPFFSVASNSPGTASKRPIRLKLSARCATLCWGSFN